MWATPYQPLEHTGTGAPREGRRVWRGPRGARGAAGVLLFETGPLKRLEQSAGLGVTQRKICEINSGHEHNYLTLKTHLNRSTWDLKM